MTIRTFHHEHARPIREGATRLTGKGLRRAFKQYKQDEAVARQQNNIDQGFSTITRGDPFAGTAVTREPAPLKSFRTKPRPNTE